jgi:MATE family multidrug resistance protein
MRNTVVVSFAVFLATLYASLPLLGNTGLWLAVGSFLACRGLLLHLLFPKVLQTI